MISEKEFELYKQIFELKEQNMGLTIGLVVLGVICFLLLFYCFLSSLENYNEK